MSDKPKIGEFDNGQPIILTPFPNGGWIIQSRAECRGEYDNDLGAYSTIHDALAALRFALAPDDTL